MDTSEYIKGLTDELKWNDTEFINTDVVYGTFEVYFRNKKMLKNIIDMGLLQYDYQIFNKYFHDSIYEDTLLSLVECYSKAFASNKELCDKFCKESYSSVSEGLKNITEIMWLDNANTDLTRFDLFLKYYFRHIGEVIEGTFKPFLKFFYGLYIICKGEDIKGVEETSLGFCVQRLKEWNSDFSILYTASFSDMGIHQWRNIAYHKSYKIINDCEVQLFYGKNNQHSKVIKRQQIEQILVSLDVIGYLHKIAFTIITIDNIDVFKETTGIPREDDVIAQIVETSFRFGFEINKFQQKDNEWFFSMICKNTHILEDEKIVEMFTLIGKLTSKNICAEIIKEKNILRKVLLSDRKLLVGPWE